MSTTIIRTKNQTSLPKYEFVKNNIIKNPSITYELGNTNKSEKINLSISTTTNDSNMSNTPFTFFGPKYPGNKSDGSLRATSYNSTNEFYYFTSSFQNYKLLVSMKDSNPLYISNRRKYVNLYKLHYDDNYIIRFLNEGNIEISSNIKIYKRPTLNGLLTENDILFYQGEYKFELSRDEKILSNASLSNYNKYNYIINNDGTVDVYLCLLITDFIYSRFQEKTYGKNIYSDRFYTIETSTDLIESDHCPKNIIFENFSIDFSSEYYANSGTKKFIYDKTKTVDYSYEENEFLTESMAQDNSYSIRTMYQNGLRSATVEIFKDSKFYTNENVEKTDFFNIGELVIPYEIKHNKEYPIGTAGRDNVSPITFEITSIEINYKGDSKVTLELLEYKR